VVVLIPVTNQPSAGLVWLYRPPRFSWFQAPRQADEQNRSCSGQGLEHRAALLALADIRHFALLRIVHTGLAGGIS
jgi:hypothetical protein